MKKTNQVEKIGEYGKAPVTIDWRYLTEDFGGRRELGQFDKAAAFLLRLLGGIVIAVGFVIALKDAEFIWSNFMSWEHYLGATFWLGWILIIFSIYLDRDRKIFNDNPEIAFLPSLLAKKSIKSVELEDYLSYELLVMLDEAFERESANFLEFVVEYLAKDESIIGLGGRLGIKASDLEKLSGRLVLEYNTHLDEWFAKILLGGFQVALQNSAEQVDLQSVFLFLCNGPLKAQLINLDIQDNELEALSLWVKNTNLQKKYLEEFALKSPLKPQSPVNRSYTSRFSPALERFARDFTAEVAKGEFILSIGRDRELDKLVELVQAGESSATIVVGAPGVGKTTFIKSFAVRMVCENVPDILKDKRLVSFEFARAFALAEDVDAFKANLENMFIEVRDAGNVILLLEDFDQMVNVRSEYSAEIIGLVIKAVDSYKLRIIATTNPEGYKKHIEPREALSGLFQKMEMAEPSDGMALQILLDEMPKFEKKYKLKIEFEALTKAIELSHQYEFDRVLPDKALDLLNETCSGAQLQGISFVSEHQVEEVVSGKVGVNVGKITAKESELLLKMEEHLHKRIIGQDEAVAAVSAALRRARAGLNKKNRPIASFLFFGPTGVGKTELAKALAATYYGDEKLMIRLDMSEYQEAENLKRLIGEAKGEEFSGGYLTEAVRGKPYSLILLDEVEKANIKVLDLFLQVLDEGHLTDGLGRKVSFANTVIIMTSNAGSSIIADQIGLGRKYIEVYRLLMPELKKVFRIEFLNRFDKVIMFKPLMPVELQQVVELQLNKVHDVLTDKGIELRWAPTLPKEILETGYDKVMGARELRRVIQDFVEDKVAQLIIEDRVKSGSIVTINNLSEFVVS